MKKIFTLICALTAVFTTAQAQDVVFTYGGETLQEGAEVTVQAEDWTDMGMGYIADSNTPKVLELKNTGAGSAMVSVTVKLSPVNMPTSCGAASPPNVRRWLLRAKHAPPPWPPVPLHVSISTPILKRANMVCAASSSPLPPMAKAQA